MSDENALVVTPQKIAVAAGGERIIRLITLSPQQKETTWRVYFESVSEDIFSNEVTRKKEKSAEVGVSIVWGALVHVAPNTFKPGLIFNSTTEKVINNGTVRIPFKEVGICDTSGKCIWKKDNSTIYPDTEVRISAFNSAPKGSYKIKYINWITNTEEVMTLPTQ